jgi:4-oxalocrotonate tautomerase
MPHIIVKLYQGKSEQQKISLTDKIVASVMEITECSEAAVSVAFEEVSPEDWLEKVYKPDIIANLETLYKQPGYDPFASKGPEANKAPEIKKDLEIKEDLKIKKDPEIKEDPEVLMQQIRSAAETARKEDKSESFNAMTWLDIELETNPEVFDKFFKMPWNELSESGQNERSIAIRRSL